jgi:two-component system, OmpR family, KDP operon response regulator KdpE
MSDRQRVLVCDDQSQSLRALQVVLCAAGFEVDATSTGSEAIDRAALCAPDAAIIELVLPDGDGVELCRRVREWSTMPMIMLSAIGEEKEKVRALDAGADDYLTKPIRAARAGRAAAGEPATSPSLGRSAARGAGRLGDRPRCAHGVP